MSKKIESLLKKRARLEAEIEAEQQLQKRQTEVMSWSEFAKIATLPDPVLKAAFIKIHTENEQQQA